jgi:hypothetical protein
LIIFVLFHQLLHVIESTKKGENTLAYFAVALIAKQNKSFTSNILSFGLLLPYPHLNGLHDTQHNDIHHDDTLHNIQKCDARQNDNQHFGTIY